MLKKVSNQYYANSSSFKMAGLFTILLAIAGGLLGYGVLNFEHYLAANAGNDPTVFEGIYKNFLQFKYLVWAAMLCMLSVIVISFGISYFVVSRIKRISKTAQNIVKTGDLSQRLSIDSQWDDLSNLSLVLNGLLDKIENLMDGIREVSNSIAHDLRTPLSGLRSDIEALKGQPSDEDKIDALLAEADRILGIFHAILRIANIEKGKRSDVFREVNLSKIIADVAELYEPLAETENIQIEVKTKSNLIVRGDGDLLFQLFANLVDNALKFSPSNTVIHLYGISDKDNIVISVEDRGDGIAAHEKERVFKHFYRGDSSRSTSGNGLGLSLVKAIADRHNAHILLEDANPGLKVIISFKPYQ